MVDLAKEIESLSNRWMGAWLSGDRAVLEAILAPDYALIVSARPHQRFERQAWLDTCETYIATSFAYRDVQVRELAPGIAVMSGIAVQEATLDGTDRSGEFWIVDVWRRNPDGAWQVCARFSGSPEAQRPSVAALGGHNPT
jgi:ketosteroid isomerase-like protein